MRHSTCQPALPLNTCAGLMQLIAEQHLPKLDYPSGTEIDAEDASGQPYKLKFRQVLVAPQPPTVGVVQGAAPWCWTTQPKFAVPPLHAH